MNSVGYLVQEFGEVRRSQKHASQVVQAGVIVVKSTVLKASLVGLVGAGGDFTLKLTDVLCTRVGYDN